MELEDIEDILFTAASIAKGMKKTSPIGIISRLHPERKGLLIAGKEDSNDISLARWNFSISKPIPLTEALISSNRLFPTNIPTLYSLVCTEDRLPS